MTTNIDTFRNLPSYLPNELLSEIFLFASCNAHDRFDSVQIPITVSHISRHWRNVALETSNLWSTITLTFPTSRNQLSQTITWLGRSRQSPLDIFLDFRDPSWDWNLLESFHPFRWQDMEAILRLLMTHAARWGRIDILTDTWAPIFTFLSYTRHLDSVPLLEHLSLSRCNAYFALKDAVFAPVDLKNPIALFGGKTAAAVRLREISLTGVHVHWAGSISALRNLTTLELRYLANDVAPSLDEFIDILACSPDLRHLTILGRGPYITSAESSSLRQDDPSTSRKKRMIELSRMISFTYGFIDINYALSLLSLFSFSSLERMSLECFADLDPLSAQDLDSSPILQLLTTGRSANPLTSTLLSLSNIRSLHLTSIVANVDTFSHFFQCLHNLTYLSLCKSAASALGALEQTSSRDDAETGFFHCAALKMLECQDIDPLPLINLVKARSKDSPIDQVSFKSDVITEEDRDRLLNRGIKIVH